MGEEEYNENKTFISFISVNYNDLYVGGLW